jgi:hypothetical protein
VIDDYTAAWLPRGNGVGVSLAASDESVAGEGLSKEQPLRHQRSQQDVHFVRPGIHYVQAEGDEPGSLPVQPDQTRPIPLGLGCTAG